MSLFVYQHSLLSNLNFKPPLNSGPSGIYCNLFRYLDRIKYAKSPFASVLLEPKHEPDFSLDCSENSIDCLRVLTWNSAAATIEQVRTSFLQRVVTAPVPASLQLPTVVPELFQLGLMSVLNIFLVVNYQSEVLEVSP